MVARSKSPRMNRRKILDEVRKSGSFLGSSGVDRKALFVKPRVGEPLKAFILPDLQPRGRSGELFPYFTVGTHWIEMQRGDGNGVVRRGMTCLRHLREEEPHAFEYLMEENIITTTDSDCVACMILENIDEQELPAGKYGVDFKLTQSFNFQVVLENEAAYAADDNQLIKVLNAGSTGRTAFLEQLCDPDLVDDGFFEDNGIYTIWRTDGRRWSVSLDLRKKCWLKDWRDKLYTLEITVPFIVPFQEQISAFLSMLPQHASAIEMIVDGFEMPEGVKPEPPDVAEDKQAARNRVRSAN